ncbi:hypothetical protein KVT40_004700 [Elsinoe batatas]|uniref:Uncharacterized protein n=1 Tax=Elsinoe batatas TaxID=2601811 RepID=A0A8K0L177_9PEZI|nr:hypothetical protein KVT40_004700 [Elsinoe batatas]
MQKYSIRLALSLRLMRRVDIPYIFSPDASDNPSISPCYWLRSVFRCRPSPPRTFPDIIDRTLVEVRSVSAIRRLARSQKALLLRGNMGGKPHLLYIIPPPYRHGSVSRVRYLDMLPSHIFYSHDAQHRPPPKRNRDDHVQDGSRKVPRLGDLDKVSAISLNDSQVEQIEQIGKLLVELTSKQVAYLEIDRTLTHMKREYEKVKEHHRTFGKSPEHLENALRDRTAQREHNEKERSAKEHAIKDAFSQLLLGILNQQNTSRVDSPATSIPSASIQEIRSLQDQIAKLQDSQTSDFGAALSAEEKYQARMNRHEREQNDRTADIRRELRELADQHKRQRDESHNQIQELKATIAELRTDQATLSDRLPKLEERTTSMENIQKASSSMGEKIDLATSSITSVASDASLVREKMALIDKLKDIQGRHDLSIKSLEKTDKSRKASIEAIDANVKKLSEKSHADHTTLKIELDNLEKRRVDEISKVDKSIAGLELRMGKFPTKSALQQEMTRTEASIQSQIGNYLQEGSSIYDNMVARLATLSKEQVQTQMDAERPKMEDKLEALTTSSAKELARLSSEIKQSFTTSIKELSNETKQIKARQVSMPTNIDSQLEDLQKSIHEMSERLDVHTRAQNEFRVRLEQFSKGQRPAEASRPPIDQQAAQQQRPLQASQPQSPYYSQSGQHPSSTGITPAVVSQLQSSPVLHHGGPRSQPQSPVYTQPAQQFGSINGTVMQGPIPGQAVPHWHTPVPGQTRLPQQSVAPAGLSNVERTQILRELFDTISRELVKPGSIILQTNEKVDKALATISPAVQEELNRIRDTFEQRLSGQNTIVTNLMATVNEANSRINRAMDKHDDVEKRVGSLERISNTALAGHFMGMGEGTPRIATPKSASPGPSDLSNVKSDINRLMNDYQSLSEKVEIQSGEIDGLKGDTAKLVDHAEQMTERDQNLRKSITAHDGEISKLNKDHTSLSTTLKLVQDQSQTTSSGHNAVRTLTETHDSRLADLERLVYTHDTLLDKADPNTIPALRMTVKENSAQLDDLEKLDLPGIKATAEKADKGIKKQIARDGVIKNSIARLEGHVKLTKTNFEAEDRVAVGRVRAAEKKRIAEQSDTSSVAAKGTS